MMEWAKNIKDIYNDCLELIKLVLQMNLFIDGGIYYENWEAVNAECKYTGTFMATLISEGGKGLLEVHNGQGGKN